MSTNHAQKLLEDLRIIINGKEYNITKWQTYHPGGQLILQQYHEKDATEAFYAFHSEKAFQQLSLMEGTSVALDTPSEITAFRNFREKIVTSPLFKGNPLWQAYKILTTYLFFALAVYFSICGYWLASCIFLGIGYQQSGWLGHDFCHHTIFRNRKVNNFFGYLTGNVLAGFSVNWWKDRHNTHHAATNILGGDPDIDNLPIFSWSEKDLYRCKDYPLAAFIVPYQQYYFIIFTPFLKLIWCLQSFFWLIDKSTQNKSYAKSRTAELGTLAIHWILIAILLGCTVPLKYWFFYIMVAEGIGGSGIAMVVFMNHYGCEKLEKEEVKKYNFITNQLYTTKNIAPGMITDWICGGLNYQIEHHLFPQMPRHNLSKVKPLVEEFCKQNKLPYISEDFLTCFLNIEKTLARVANSYKKIKEGKE